MLGFFFHSMKDNLDEVGQLEAPSLKPDGNAHKAKRRPGFPFSSDDKLSSYSDLKEFEPHSSSDYEDQQYRFANPVQHITRVRDTYDAVGNPMNLGAADKSKGATEINRGSW